MLATRRRSSGRLNSRVAHMSNDQQLVLQGPPQSPIDIMENDVRAL